MNSYLKLLHFKNVKLANVSKGRQLLLQNEFTDKNSTFIKGPGTGKMPATLISSLYFAIGLRKINIIKWLCN